MSHRSPAPALDRTATPTVSRAIAYTPLLALLLRSAAHLIWTHPYPTLILTDAYDGLPAIDTNRRYSLAGENVAVSRRGRATLEESGVSVEEKRESQCNPSV
jgi:hypothetical protein